MKAATIALALCLPLAACGGQTVTLVSPRAIDGDTIAATNLDSHVRLLGIDAPEMARHPCRDRARTSCDDTDPAKAVASKRALQRLLDSGPVYCKLTKRDVYRRWLATCAVRRQSVSGYMLASGLAVPYSWRGNNTS